MFVQHKRTKNLIEVLTMQELYDPFSLEIIGQSHSGEELQDETSYIKSELMFPSGEELPLCWVDPHYRETKVAASAMSV